MHSHERTLLANLGFADRDKKEPRHDLAIQYLMQPDKSRVVAEYVTRKMDDLLGIEEIDPQPERQISKGEGKYRTTIGFADLVIDFRRLRLVDVQEARGKWMKQEIELGERRIFDKWMRWRSEQEDGKTELEPEVQELTRECKQLIRNLLQGGWDMLAYNSFSVGFKEKEREVPSELRTQVERFEQALAHVIRNDYSLDKWATAKKIPSVSHDKDATNGVIHMLERRRERKDKEEHAELLKARLGEQIEPVWTGGHWQDQALDLPVYGLDRRILLEVKIQPIPIGDILRQMELYTSHLTCDWRVVATAYAISQEDMKMLESKRIDHIRLGDAFDKFCETQAKAPQKTPSLEI